MFSVLCDHNCKVQYSVGVAPSKPKKKRMNKRKESAPG